MTVGALWVPSFVDAAMLASLRRAFDGPLDDAKASAGKWAVDAKRCRVVPPARVQALTAKFVRYLLDHDEVGPALYPSRGTRPMLVSYAEGDGYGPHEDNPIHGGVRTDISYTLMLSDPNAFEGGSLVLDGTPIELGAGDLVAYPSGTPHEVTTVIRGERRVVVGWLQSLVRQPERRAQLLDLHRALEDLAAREGTQTEAFAAVHRVRTSLMRAWAET